MAKDIKLSKKELEILCSIYRFRFLSQKQIAALHFRNNNKIAKEYCRKVLSKMKNQKKLVLSERLNKETIIYTLTRAGLKYVVNSLCLESYNTVSQLKIKENNLDHQLYLNEFVITATSFLKDGSYKYYDEKDVCTLFNGVRPDGIIETDKAFYFIENDMGTERMNSLHDKWNKYRQFYTGSYINYNIDKPIIILFVLNNKEVLRRAKSIYKTIELSFLDVVSPNFDIVIGDTKELTNYMYCKENNLSKVNEIRQNLQKSKFCCDSGTFSDFGDYSFDLYSRLLNENRKIVKINGECIEYVLDDCFFMTCSTIKKVKMLESINYDFNEKHHRSIKYILVFKDYKHLLDFSSAYNLIGLPNIYFNTFERLRMMPIHKAAVAIDMYNNIFNFTDASLKCREFLVEKEFKIS